MVTREKAHMSLKSIVLTPVQTAVLEIMCLDHEPELRQDSIIGGPTPPAMKEENERKRAEYQKRKLAIIEKHGVAADYLTPLLLEEERLLSRLLPIQQEIAQLKGLIK